MGTQPRTLCPYLSKVSMLYPLARTRELSEAKGEVLRPQNGVIRPQSSFLEPYDHFWAMGDAVAAKEQHLMGLAGI